MEKERKELKWFSILILALATFSLVSAIVRVCVKGLPQLTEIPEGMTKEMANIVVIISFALSLVALLPQIYIGVKGIKIANGAPSGKAHIVWAIILAVFAVIAVISAISSLTKVLNFDTVLNVLDPAIDVVIYVFYYIYACKIAKA